MIGRGKVDSILKYQAIGFDMDHTFVRYKMKDFIKHINESCSVFLVNHCNYPQEIFPLNEEEAKRGYEMFFRAVFDHKTGLLLKIGCSMAIMRAFYGFERLPDSEITRIYGEPPVLPNYTVLSHHHPDFTNMHEYYSAGISPLIARIVDLKKNGHPFLAEKTYFDIMKDISAAGAHNFVIKDFEVFETRKYPGYFFPKFISQPKRYINPINPEFLKRLKVIKDRGALVYIASNSYYHFGNVLLRNAIGENWPDYFDFVIFDSKKPLFFDMNIKNPESFKNLDGAAVELSEVLKIKSPTKREKVLLGGHVAHINKYLFETRNKNFCSAFFGDTIATDCVLAFNKQMDIHWDIIFIMEELQEIETGMPEQEYFASVKNWGSSLHDRRVTVGGVEKTTIFNFADSDAQRTFSKLDAEDCLDFFEV